MPDPEDIKIFKEKIINDYISDLLTDGLNNINIDMIKRDLSLKLHETPAIELKYKTEEIILEDGKKGTKNDKLEYIIITYSYDKLIGDESIPIPVMLPYRV
jgi:hypothetical protein